MYSVSVHTIQQYKLFSGYTHKHQKAQEVQPGTALPLAKTEKVPWPWGPLFSLIADFLMVLFFFRKICRTGNIKIFKHSSGIREVMTFPISCNELCFLFLKLKCISLFVKSFLRFPQLFVMEKTISIKSTFLDIHMFQGLVSSILTKSKQKHRTKITTC